MLALTMTLLLSWFDQFAQIHDQVAWVVALEGSAEKPTEASKADVPVAKQPAAPDGKKLSPAQIIVRLQKSLDVGARWLAKTKEELNDPHSEYHKAQEAFQAIDKRLNGKRAEAQRLKKEGKAAEAATLDDPIKSLETQRQLALERFNLALKQLRILQENSAALEVRIKQCQEVIALIQGGAGVPPAQPAAPGTTAGPTTAAPPGAEKTPSPAPASNPFSLAPPLSAPPPVPGDDIATAKNNATFKEKQLQQARDKMKSAQDRLANIRQNVDIEKKLLETLHEREANAVKIHDFLQKEFAKKRSGAVEPAEQLQLERRIADAEQLVQKVRREIRESNEDFAELEREDATIQAFESTAQQEVDRKAREATAAEDRVTYLENPLAPPSIWRWLKLHGPKIIFILAGMLVFQLLVRQIGQQFVKLVSRHKFRGQLADRENRADTIVGVFRKTASFMILVGGTLMILDAVNIPIVPLLGSAAVVGLAVAFGAQSLIKDYFCGFMILLEDQYGINDIVKIGDATGQVEKITLRMTVLRDIEGAVHFIPHGTITTVSNFTHRWSRAFFELVVPYKEDVDRVINELQQLCQQMRDDPVHGSSILDKPEMLGVDQLGDKGIVIKFFLRTNPLRQWVVKRELLRRIQKKFAEMGIEFSHG